MLGMLLSQHWASMTLSLFSTATAYPVMTVNYTLCTGFSMKPLKYSIFQWEQKIIIVLSLILSVHTLYLEDGFINKRGNAVQCLFTPLHLKAEWLGERPLSDPSYSWSALRSWTMFFCIPKECPIYQSARCFVVELLKLFHYMQAIQYS